MHNAIICETKVIKVVSQFTVEFGHSVSVVYFFQGNMGKYEEIHCTKINKAAIENKYI